MKTLVLFSIIMLTNLNDFKTPQLMKDSGYQIGDVVSDFELKNVDGKIISLSDYNEAKGFIITFTCNTCPFAIAYEDRIIALDKKYASKGYPVIAINPNNPEISKGDDFASMQQRAKDKGFTFPYLFDDGQKIYPQYGATRTPHVFLLNKENGALIVEYIGAIDNNSQDATAVSDKYVENAVDSLLTGDKVQKTETRAIGCSIKVDRN